MKQFIYSRLCHCTETKYRLLLLRMATMENGFAFKKSRVEAKAKNVLFKID